MTLRSIALISRNTSLPADQIQTLINKANLSPVKGNQGEEFYPSKPFWTLGKDLKNSMTPERASKILEISIQDVQILRRYCDLVPKWKSELTQHHAGDVLHKTFAFDLRNQLDKFPRSAQHGSTVTPLVTAMNQLPEGTSGAAVILALICRAIPVCAVPNRTKSWRNGVGIFDILNFVKKISYLDAILKSQTSIADLGATAALLGVSEQVVQKLADLDYVKDCRTAKTNSPCPKLLSVRTSTCSVVK